MDFNKVKSMMQQQIGALKNLEELLDHDAQQGANHDISQESIDLLMNHVDQLKKICNTAVALADHYQPQPKSQAKSTTIVADPEDSDDDDVDETPEEVKEPAKKTRVKKEKPNVPKVEPEPVVIEDDFDDLLS